MKIAKIENNTIVEYGEHFRLFPNVSFPNKTVPDEWLTENNCLKLSSTKEFDSATQSLVAVEPYLENGIAYAVKVVDKTDAQITYDNKLKEDTVRKQRDRLLAESDWTQMPDSPLTTEKKAEWATYRQALRDITDDADFPNVAMPDYPDAPVITIPEAT